jgi:membrane protein implicated in regulation of membrane protease activity
VAVARDDHPHLPVGREPGAQSRRRRLGRTLGGCAAPAFAFGGLVVAALVIGFGALLGSLPGGPPAWPFALAAVVALVLFWGFAIGLWRGARPRYARGLEVAVERDAVRRGERVAAVATGDGTIEVGLVCTEHYDVWREGAADDSRSRGTRSAVVCSTWSPAPYASLGQRVELAVPADAPYSYEGDCVSFAWSLNVRRLGERRVGPPAPVWVDP